MWKASFRAMGTNVEVCIGVDTSLTGDDIEAAYQHVVAEIERFESKFSRFRENSELSYINANPGVWLTVSPEMATVLRLATEAYTITGALFDPCLGNVMQRIGYGETFETVKNPLPGQSVQSRVPRLDLSAVFQPLHGNELHYMISPRFDKVYLFPNYSIDLGGIAKGWIVEQAARSLRSRGISDFLFSAGGDMVCAGGNGNRPWQVGITNPWQWDESVLTLNVDSSCVATSGTYRRQWSQGTEQMHHIVNPSSGKPAVTDIVSCTVVAPTLTAAEVYAKTCLLLGYEKGTEWLASKNQLGWVVVRTDRVVVDPWNGSRKINEPHLCLQSS